MAYFSREKLAGLTGNKGDFQLATHFSVELSGKTIGGIIQVNGLESESDVVDYRDADDSVHSMRARHGSHKVGNVTFVRYVGNTDEFVKWFMGTREGNVQRIPCTINFLGDNDAVVSQVNLFEVFPYAYQIDGFDSKSSALLTETISCKYETVTYA